MPRALVWTLYAACVLVWSSTWVVIAVGLEDIAPFFGAGIRFSLAGLGAARRAPRCSRRSLRTDFVLAALVGLLPFATTYGLIYWAEQYVTSGLTAVLFGVLPLYVALLAARRCCRPSRCAPRLLLGVGIALVGLVVAFSESLTSARASTPRWPRSRWSSRRWPARSATSRSSSAARSSTRS